MSEAIIPEDEKGRLRITTRKDGIQKLERISFGHTGNNIYREPARGHWVVTGYRKNGVFSRRLATLRHKLNP